MDPTSRRMTPTRVTDPKAVAAITHPLRMRLLGELARRGSARAVDLAQVVGEPANAVSFHLRQLARYDLIEEDPDHASNRRERWWRQTSERGFHLDTDAIRAQNGGEAAVDVLRRVAEGHVLALHRTIWEQTHAHAEPADPAEPTGEAEPPGAQSATARSISGDFAVRLTGDELHEMRQELRAFLEKWSQRSALDPGTDAERRGYYGVVMAAPEDEMFRTYNQLQEPR